MAIAESKNNITSVEGIPAQELPQEKRSSRFTEAVASIEHELRTRISWRSFLRFCRGLARVFIGAIIWFSIAHFVPELREKIPAFYEIVDLILGGLEHMSEYILLFFGR